MFTLFYLPLSETELKSGLMSISWIFIPVSLRANYIHPANCLTTNYSLLLLHLPLKLSTIQNVIIWKWRSNATGFIDWTEIWRKLLHQTLIENGCNRNWQSYGEIITLPLILVTVKEGSRKKEWVNENIIGFFRLFCLENVNISGILLPFFSGQKVRFWKARVDIERANCLISHPPHLQLL